MRARLEDATDAQLREAVRRSRTRIAAIDAGTAPATPDSRPNAEQLLKRAEAELRRRGEAS